MAMRRMNGPEPLWRLKVVRQDTRVNPDYTGYGCGLPVSVPTGETFTTYYGPYLRRHAAATVRGQFASALIVSAEIERCEPVWEVTEPSA